MSNSIKKRFGFGGAALALVLAAGLSMTVAGDASACGAKAGKAQVSTASVAGGSCGVTKTASAAPAAACGTQAKVVTASSACCPSKGVQAKTAEMTFPAGIEVERVAVDGGVNYVFTGKELASVESYLAAHMSHCGTEAEKDCGRVCTVTRKDTAVVLAVRGENPEACCVGMMTASFDGAQAGEAGCGVKGAAAPKGAKAQKSNSVSKKS